MQSPLANFDLVPFELRGLAPKYCFGVFYEESVGNLKNKVPYLAPFELK